MNGSAEQAIADELRGRTRSSRVTVRADRPPAFFPVVAESCADGVPPIAGDSSVDISQAPTFLAVSEGQVVIQDDCLTAVPPTPREVVALYGVRAQMLAPVTVDDTLRGTLSVHSTTAREWSEEDVAALHAAAAELVTLWTER